MKRESFGSRLGFLLVSAGCAIGIGNVWRFPYITGQNGGGYFVLFYLICLVIMGMLHHICDRVPGLWAWVVGVVTVVSVSVSLRDALAPSLWIPFDALPFAWASMGWVLPAVLAAVIAVVLSHARRRPAKAAG